MFAILILDEGSMYASSGRIYYACIRNTEISSTHRLLECKKAQMRGIISWKLPQLNILSKEDKLRMILNVSYENYVISDVMKYVKNVLFIAWYNIDGHSQYNRWCREVLRSIFGWCNGREMCVKCLYWLNCTFNWSIQLFLLLFNT